MKKPPNVLYGVEEKMPAGVLLLSGLQHVGLMSMFLLYPVLVAKACDASAETAAALVSLTLLAMAAGTILQVIPIGPFGSGYLCQPIPSIVYLVPSLIAARYGGLALVFGMTIAAGLFELVLSRAMRRLRPIFPPEIVGLVILLVGIATGMVALRIGFGEGKSEVQPLELAIGLGTLLLMSALNVWGGKYLRIFCVLIGMAVGYVVSVLLGTFLRADAEAIAHADLVDLPSLSHLSWSFDAALMLPFAVAAVAATLKVMGNVTTSQKANDAEWVRADMNKVSRGVLADGMGTVIAGAIGAQGLNSSPTVVGLASASGVLSRHVAYPVAAILVVLAFLPKVGALFYLMPRMVAAAALVFSSSFIMVNGLQVMTSRLLDARKTLLIGLALIAALAVDAHPGLVKLLPAAWQPILGTSLVLGTLVGLGLNVVFRLGMRRVQSLLIDPGAVDVERVQEFLHASGEQWGARADVIERAKFNLAQSIETIVEGCNPEGPLEVAATFDEFNLDIRVIYQGPLLELPTRRPSNEEIMETEEGHRRLAGFMLRRQADRVSSSHRNGRSTVTFHFDH
jgi:NCS2 family nucleobase:cation symporter-2